MRAYRGKLSDEEEEWFKKARQADVEKPRQFVNFAFYKVDPSFLRTVGDEERSVAAAQLAEVIESARKKMLVYSYSTLGIRSECDFLLWRISYRLDDFEEMTAAILRTRMGRHLNSAHSYLAMTKTSIYVEEHDFTDREPALREIVIGEGKYLFVYPFVKTRPWYVLPEQERKNAMREHILVGHQFPSVKLNTAYSFGLDDQDFVVAFETDYPQDFLDLVHRLRETEASTYTEKDTPIFTCTRQDLQSILAHSAGVDPK